MILLELERIAKSFAPHAEDSQVLDDVWLRVDLGEFVVIWGMRRSGRSTLLRIAAGVDSPDCGVVRFRGRQPRDLGGGLVDNRIAFCRKRFSVCDGPTIFDQLLAGQEALGVPRSVALRSARDALRKADAERCATLTPRELRPVELARAIIARALTVRPDLIIIDEPTIGVELTERDAILSLLRGMADEGVSVLATTGETPCLSYADRALTISKGKLRGAVFPNTASVVPLHREAPPAA